MFLSSRYSNFSFKDLSISRIVGALLRRICHPFKLLVYFFPVGFNSKNRHRIKALKNKHLGSRCFIIASGPSLKRINFKLLEGEITFAMNRGYLLSEKFHHSPNYLFCIDKKTQLLQFTKEYDDVLDMVTFYNWDLRKLFNKNENRYFIKDRFSCEFKKENGTLFGNGKSVTYTCIQMAFHMGFKDVYLIGKDHNYEVNRKVVPGTSIKTEIKQSNHFTNDYYKPDQLFDAPDYKTEEYAYKIARDYYEKNGRVIKDATIDGKLQVFEKVKFSELF